MEERDYVAWICRGQERGLRTGCIEEVVEEGWVVRLDDTGEARMVPLDELLPLMGEDRHDARVFVVRGEIEQDGIRLPHGTLLVERTLLIKGGTFSRKKGYAILYSPEPCMMLGELRAPPYRVLPVSAALESYLLGGE